MSLPVHEVRDNGSWYYDTKEVAKIIRIVLKRNYPKTKFGVRMERYSMGSSINIFYDGKAKGAPKKEDVQKHTEHYVNHDFDGMTDSSICINHWMMPDYTAILAFRDSMVGSKAIRVKQPHKDAVRVLFGSGFVFVNDFVEVRRHYDGTETRCPA